MGAHLPCFCISILLCLLHSTKWLKHLGWLLKSMVLGHQSPCAAGCVKELMQHKIVAKKLWRPEWWEPPWSINSWEGPWGWRETPGKSKKHIKFSFCQIQNFQGRKRIHCKALVSCLPINFRNSCLEIVCLSVFHPCLFPLKNTFMISIHICYFLIITCVYFIWQELYYTSRTRIPPLFHFRSTEPMQLWKSFQMLM